MSSEILLELNDVSSSLGESEILHDVSLSVSEDSIVALMGRNGVGKTTTLRTIMGLTSGTEGQIEFAGESIHGLPTEEIAAKGISLVPEERQIFSNLTVHENLEIAHNNTNGSLWEINEVYEMFPVLDERRDAAGTSLSGGQQQMLAIGRALVRNTELLMLDEPMEGLAPAVIADIKVALSEITTETTVLIVAQDESILELCDHVYVLENGRVIYDGPPEPSAVRSQLQI